MSNKPAPPPPPAKKSAQNIPMSVPRPPVRPPSVPGIANRKSSLKQGSIILSPPPPPPPTSPSITSDIDPLRMSVQSSVSSIWENESVSR